MLYLSSSDFIIYDYKKIANAMCKIMSEEQTYTINDVKYTIKPSSGTLFIFDCVDTILAKDLVKILYNYINEHFEYNELSLLNICEEYTLIKKTLNKKVSIIYENTDSVNSSFVWNIYTLNSNTYKIPHINDFATYGLAISSISSIIYDPHVMLKYEDLYSSLSFPLITDYTISNKKSNINTFAGIYMDLFNIDLKINEDFIIKERVSIINWNDINNVNKETDFEGNMIYGYCIVLDEIYRYKEISATESEYINSDDIIYNDDKYNIDIEYICAESTKNTYIKSKYVKDRIIQLLEENVFDKKKEINGFISNYNDKYGVIFNSKGKLFIYEYDEDGVIFLNYVKKDIDKFVENEKKRLSKLKESKNYKKIKFVNNPHVLISFQNYLMNKSKSLDIIKKYESDNKCSCSVYLALSPKKIEELTNNELILEVDRYSYYLNNNIITKNFIIKTSGEITIHDIHKFGKKLVW